MKKKSRKWYIRELDKLVSERARRLAGNFCDFCLLRGQIPKLPVTEAFHFLSRAHYSARWLLENLWGSCSGCNIRYEIDADFVAKVVEWYKEKWGIGTWDELARRYHTAQPVPTTELKELYERLTNEP